MCVRRKNGINSHAENGFMNGFYVISNDIIFMMSNSLFKLSTKACFFSMVGFSIVGEGCSVVGYCWVFLVLIIGEELHRGDL